MGGYIDDVAGAVASVARRRPIATAMVLAASIAVVLTGERGIDPSLFLAWIVAPAFVAGATLAGTHRAERWTWTVDRCVLVGLLVGSLVGLRALASGGVDPWVARLAVAGVSFQLGAATRNFLAVGCATALGVLTLSPTALVAMSGRSTDQATGGPALYAGYLGVIGLMLAARHGRWLALMPLAMLAAVWRESAIWGIWSLRNPSLKDVAWFSVILLLAMFSVVLPIVAGRAAAALATPASGDPFSRLIVRFQRDRWWTALIAFGIGTALFRSAWNGPEQGDLVIASAAVIFVQNACFGPSFALGSLAPWVAASALCVPLSMSYCAPLRSHSFELTVWPEAVVALYVPLVVGLVAARARSMRFPWWGWLTIAGVAVVAVANVDRRLRSALHPDGLGGDITWCAAVALLVHAVATSQVSARLVLALSPIASFLVIDAFYAIRGFVSDEYGFVPSPILPALAAGPVAALLALGARRVRSMTAVPEDHPSLELAAARAAATGT